LKHSWSSTAGPGTSRPRARPGRRASVRARRRLDDGDPLVARIERGRREVAQAQQGRRPGRGRRLGHGQARPGLALRAQHVVDVLDRRAQVVGGERGREVERGVAAVAEPGGEGGVPRLAAQVARGGLVEHRERGVQPGGDGVAAQQPRAEAVDRRDPRALGVARRVALAELEQALADAVAQLARRLLGEGDREDPAGRELVLDHVAHEALDEHRRLAAARGGAEQQVALALAHRARLLAGERAALGSHEVAGHRHASHRQIVG
jgi:hypothetical protein